MAIDLKKKYEPYIAKKYGITIDEYMDYVTRDNLIQRLEGLILKHIREGSDIKLDLVTRKYKELLRERDEHGKAKNI